MLREFDLKKLEDPNVRKELKIKAARLEAACVECDRLNTSANITQEDLTKLNEVLKEFADANEDINDYFETLLKK